LFLLHRSSYKRQVLLEYFFSRLSLSLDAARSVARCKAFGTFQGDIFSRRAWRYIWNRRLAVDFHSSFARDHSPSRTILKSRSFAILVRSFRGTYILDHLESLLKSSLSCRELLNTSRFIRLS